MDERMRAIVKHANETGHVQGLRSVLRRATCVTVGPSGTVELERMLDAVVETVARIALDKADMGHQPTTLRRRRAASRDGLLVRKQ